MRPACKRPLVVADAERPTLTANCAVAIGVMMAVRVHGAEPMMMTAAAAAAAASAASAATAATAARSPCV